MLSGIELDKKNIENYSKTRGFRPKLHVEDDWGLRLEEFSCGIW